MRKNGIIKLLTASFWLTLAICVVGEDEPKFESKTAREWAAALKDDNPSVHEKAANALQALGEAAIPALIDALKDKSALSRVLSASVLMNNGPKAKAAVPALKAALKDEDVVFRLRAAQALVKISPEADSASIPILIESLKLKLEFAQSDAAIILGSLGTRAQTAIPALTAALNDPSETVRKNAAEALKKIQAK